MSKTWVQDLVLTEIASFKNGLNDAVPTTLNTPTFLFDGSHEIHLADFPSF